jgi:hypothetical protein
MRAVLHCRARVMASEHQTPTVRVTIAEIMATSAFKAGVADARAGRGYRREYEDPPVNTEGGRINWRWNYERGRQWAMVAGSMQPEGKEGERVFELAGIR